MSLYPKARLCQLCKNIFTGHWVAKDSIRVNQEEDDLKEEKAFSDSGSDTSSSHSFYEAPDWVTVLTNNDVAVPQSSVAYHSPPHHSFLQLKESASQDCYVCKILFDKARDEIKAVATHIRRDINDLQSCVIARPAVNDCFEEETIQLAVSYFTDGVIRRQMFAFTVEILLYKYSPSQNVIAEVVQPPLHHQDNEDPLTRSIGRIKQWLSECDNNHQECRHKLQPNINTSNAHELPTRLLHLERNAEDFKVSLCDAQHRPLQTRYATLSHCWGSLQPVKLLSDNYKQFRRSVDFSSLPRTFQDAITLSLALNIEYIWIDSLCIIQDLPDDWVREASLMCSVYSNSWINLAATSSQDGDGGLFHKSSLVQNCVINAGWTGLPAGMYLCFDETAWQRRIQSAPLNQRGWVLQERLLSPRTIHCAYDQMWWSCQAAPNCCETFPRGALIPSWAPSTSLTRLIQLSDDDFVLWNNEWLDIVMTYTKTKLTYRSDKLIAFAGIAQEAQGWRGIPGTDYLAGLWREGLPSNLLWRVTGTGTRVDTTYRAPSWSWASVDGEVHFQFPQVGGDLVAELLGGDTSVDQEWFGSVRNGWLRIRGPLFGIVLSSANGPRTSSFSLTTLCLGSEVYEEGQGFVEILDREDLYASWPALGRQLHYACVYSSCIARDAGAEHESEGLILEVVPGKPDSYHRIGWLRVFHGTSWIPDCQRYMTTYCLY